MFCDWRRASSVLGRFISKNLKYATPASAMIARMSVFLQFMSDATLPPDDRSNDSGNQRHQNQKNPAQAAQPFRIEGERERLRNFWRDTDHLFAAQQPVHCSGHKIERRLILHDGTVLNEFSVAHPDEP